MVKNLDYLKIFLAEYAAYENMLVAYESLMSLDGQIESYRQLCQFFKSQFQPI